MDEIGRLRSWAKEDGIYADDICFDGYTISSKKVLGTCTITADGYHITLNEKLKGHPILSLETLWHEYCHVWTDRDKKHHGHTLKFWQHYFTKPWMILIYCISGTVLL